MRSAVEKYFNDSFDLSHAAFISIAVHFIFFSMQPFGIFDKPLVQEKKHKKIRLEVVKKPEVVKVPQKKLEVKKPVLRKKLVMPKPVAVPVSNPIRKIESNPVQVVRPMVAPLRNTAPKIVEISASTVMQQPHFKSSPKKYSALPREMKTVSQNSSSIVSSPVSKSQTGRFISRDTRMNVFAKASNAPIMTSGAGNSQAASLVSSGVNTGFDRKGFQPRTSVGKIDNLNRGVGGHSTLVDTRGGLNHSFKPQVRNVAVLNLDNQDELSGEELNDLWNGYTTTVRQMIARAKIYPPAARDKGQQGKINLSFKLGKNGGVLKLLVEHSSGHAMLDKAARDAVKNAGPFPPIPEKLNKHYVLLKLPVSFILR